MQELLHRIQAAEQIVLVAHIHPDGDAAGSLIGLGLGLQQLGKTVTAVLADGVPTTFEFLATHLTVATELPSYDPGHPSTLCVCLDLADAARTGFRAQIEAYAKGNALAFIDHHPFGDLEKLTATHYHSLHVSSCAELIYHVLTNLGARFTPPIATALLTGMYTDTGGFQYTNTSTETLEIGAELMRRGARLRTIVDHTNRQKSIATLRLLGLALERMTITNNGTCAVSVVSYEDIKGAKATSEDVSGIINQMNVLPGPKVCILITELEPGVLRGSIRSNDQVGQKVVNVTPLAKLLGGGGHARASGFMFSAHLEHNDKAPSQWRVI